MFKRKVYVPKFDKKGGAKLSHRYKEILKLYDMLQKEGIPVTLRRNFDGWQIIYPEAPNFPEGKDHVVCSVIEHFGSYGQEYDLLDIMGLLTQKELECDSVLGGLSAANVFSRIKMHWEGEKHGEYL